MTRVDPHIPPPTPLMTKEEIRLFAQDVRDGMDDSERAVLAQDLGFQLVQLPFFLSATCIMSYAPIRGEISPAPALELRVKLMGETSTRIAHPRVTGHHEMEARVGTADMLLEGSSGILEPDVTGVFVEPSDIDVVLVPGMAFDRRGFRVGYGKGFYDTFIARLPRTAITVGLSYDETVVSYVPLEVHDRAVDYLVTPTATHTC